MEHHYIIICSYCKTRWFWSLQDTSWELQQSVNIRHFDYQQRLSAIVQCCKTLGISFAKIHRTRYFRVRSYCTASDVLVRRPAHTSHSNTRTSSKIGKPASWLGGQGSKLPPRDVAWRLFPFVYRVSRQPLAPLSLPDTAWRHQIMKRPWDATIIVHRQGVPTKLMKHLLWAQPAWNGRVRNIVVHYSQMFLINA